MAIYVIKTLELHIALSENTYVSVQVLCNLFLKIRILASKISFLWQFSR